MPVICSATVVNIYVTLKMRKLSNEERAIQKKLKKEKDFNL
jgi:hypothetical protein